MKTEVTAAAVTANVEVIPSLASVRASIVYDDKGNASFVKGAKVTAEQLADLACEDIATAKSASIRAVNTLRLAKQLPAVKVKEGDKEKTVEAFDYAIERVRTKCGTDSAFYNIKGLIEACEVVDKNGLKASPFAVKECLGYLKAAKVINEETGKLQLTDKVAKELKGGIGVNKVREVVKEQKEKKGLTGGSKKTETTKAPEAPVKAEDSADKLSTDLQILIRRWDKLTQTEKVEDIRKACGEYVATLAKLAGLTVS